MTKNGTNVGAKGLKITAKITTPGRRKTEEKTVELVGVHIGGRRFILLRDDLGRLVQIEVTEQVEEQLRWALRKTRR